MMTPPLLINDRAVADFFSMSTSWVRGQRYKRRHGIAHILNVDPVTLGGAVRYRRTDIIELAKRVGAYDLWTMRNGK